MMFPGRLFPNDGMDLGKNDTVEDLTFDGRNLFREIEKQDVPPQDPDKLDQLQMKWIPSYRARNESAFLIKKKSMYRRVRFGEASRNNRLKIGSGIALRDHVLKILRTFENNHQSHINDVALDSPYMLLISLCILKFGPDLTVMASLQHEGLISPL
ncbi:hypothetical protein Tco_0257752 [Tanacetum coccineum]|uniref:Uncharacterized protein n=1 Tax=Tanacetum coccineum TaxID=301880 RepID=A0ABQ5CKN0_9ASTR